MPQVECDGISLNLYATLAKETRKMHSARVFIPSTVVFEHGFASAWYFSTSAMEVKRRHDREISAQDIYKEFSKSHSNSADIVAVFMTAARPGLYVDKLEQLVTVSHYMNKQELQSFLFSGGEKPRGMLQKYVYPKGWCATSVQVSWSPKLTIVQAVRNPYSLYDKTKSVGVRGATNEISINTQIATTNSVTIAVKQLSELVHQHITVVEHVEMSGMVLHFKVDHENRVLLLYSTSLRVGKGTSGIMASDTHVPLNLLHRFTLKETHDMEQEMSAYWASKKETHARLKREEREKHEQQEQSPLCRTKSSNRQGEEDKLDLSGAQHVESFIVSSQYGKSDSLQGSSESNSKQQLPPLVRHATTTTRSAIQQDQREDGESAYGGTYRLLRRAGTMKETRFGFAHLKKLSSFLCPADEALSQTPNVRRTGGNSKWTVADAQRPVIATALESDEATAVVGEVKHEEQEAERRVDGNSDQSPEKTQQKDADAASHRNCEKADRSERQEEEADQRPTNDDTTSTTNNTNSNSTDDKEKKDSRQQQGRQARELLEDIVYSIQRAHLEGNKKAICHRFCLRAPALNTWISAEYLLHVMREMQPRVIAVSCASSDKPLRLTLTTAAGSPEANEEVAEWFAAMEQRIRETHDPDTKTSLDDLEECIFPPLSEDDGEASAALLRLYGVNPEHTPEVEPSPLFVWFEVRVARKECAKYVSYTRNRVLATRQDDDAVSFAQRRYYGTAKSKASRSTEQPSPERAASRHSPRVATYPALSLLVTFGEESTGDCDSVLHFLLSYPEERK